ncbi:hypothetical protein COLO4_16411 [Corchorus olitorius]|uniref:Uncharacterized protein n=1 Tax=Corchorus olitorius TaxID=93759 RepID=A0A1R3JHJ9_9ROSI|nr:hypothetical protein COLO4_16411 [Corchorus olitorius]
MALSSVASVVDPTAQEASVAAVRKRKRSGYQ